MGAFRGIAAPEAGGAGCEVVRAVRRRRRMVAVADTLTLRRHQYDRHRSLETGPFVKMSGRCRAPTGPPIRAACATSACLSRSSVEGSSEPTCSRHCGERTSSFRPRGGPLRPYPRARPGRSASTDRSCCMPRDGAIQGRIGHIAVTVARLVYGLPLTGAVHHNLHGSRPAATSRSRRFADGTVEFSFGKGRADVCFISYAGVGTDADVIPTTPDFHPERGLRLPRPCLRMPVMRKTHENRIVGRAANRPRSIRPRPSGGGRSRRAHPYPRRPPPVADARAATTARRRRARPGSPRCSAAPQAASRTPAYPPSSP